MESRGPGGQVWCTIPWSPWNRSFLWVPRSRPHGPRPENVSSTPRYGAWISRGPPFLGGPKIRVPQKGAPLFPILKKNVWSSNRQTVKPSNPRRMAGTPQPRRAARSMATAKPSVPGAQLADRWTREMQGVSWNHPYKPIPCSLVV